MDNAWIQIPKRTGTSGCGLLWIEHPKGFMQRLIRTRCTKNRWYSSLRSPDARRLLAGVSRGSRSSVEPPSLPNTVISDSLV
jgi:hypothetical protein